MHYLDQWTTRKLGNNSFYSDWEILLTYDKNGNLLTNLTEGYDCINDYIGKETYFYNAWGQLVNYNNDVGETASYTYYSDGLRASKTIGDNTTKYYYDGDNVINETLNNNNYATNVMGVNGYVSRRQNGTTGYLFKDAHGDVLSIYTSTSNKVTDYTYDAWGEIRTKNESSSFENNPLRYYGQYYDYESGMTYLRARYYDSSIKRFITEDPAKDGSNWYAYCGNNPVMMIDPSGLYKARMLVTVGFYFDYHNLDFYDTGVYCDLRDLVNNMPATKYIGLEWYNTGDSASTIISFNKGESRYQIKIGFNSVTDGSYASSVNIYKDGNVVGSDDPVKQLIDGQNAHFFLKADENGDGLKVQAKISTMYWLFEQNPAYQYLEALICMAQDEHNDEGIDLQTCFDDLGNTPLVEIDFGFGVPSYQDILKDTVGL